MQPVSTSSQSPGGPINISTRRYSKQSLGKFDKAFDDRVDKELDKVSASMNQLSDAVTTLGLAIPPDWRAKIKEIQAQIDAIKAKQITGTTVINCVGLDTFVLSALTGYPNIACVVANISGLSSALKIPDAGLFDGHEVNVKVANSDAGGNLVVSTVGGVVLINAGLTAPATDYTLPSTPSVTIYAATFKWSAAAGAWEVTNTAIY